MTVLLFKYLQDLPVHSLRTNRTYVNIFCAQCHGDATGDLMPYNVSIVCNNLNIVTGCGLSLLDDIMTDDNYFSSELRWTRYLRGNILHRMGRNVIFKTAQTGFIFRTLLSSRLNFFSHPEKIWTGWPWLCVFVRTYVPCVLPFFAEYTRSS